MTASDTIAVVMPLIVLIALGSAAAVRLLLKRLNNIELIVMDLKLLLARNQINGGARDHDEP